jgi:hypothetical protein
MARTRLSREERDAAAKRADAVKRAGEIIRKTLLGVDDLILIHNHIRATARTRQGTRGFRFWWEPKETAPPVVECSCGWRPELGRHYRIKREKD